jgi:hypothetical protein
MLLHVNRGIPMNIFSKERSLSRSSAVPVKECVTPPGNLQYNMYKFQNWIQLKQLICRLSFPDLGQWSVCNNDYYLIISSSLISLAILVYGLNLTCTHFAIQFRRSLHQQPACEETLAALLPQPTQIVSQST